MGKDSQPILSEQLRQTCKVVGARWAVWLRRTGETWGYDLEYGLTRIRRDALVRFLSEPGTSTWLSGALTVGRTRSRRAGDLSEELGCSRVYVFSKPQAAEAILAGADDLPATAQSFFRIVALSNLHTEESTHTDDAGPDPWKLGDKNELFYGPDAMFSWVLEGLVRIVPCQAAFLATRTGETFKVEVAWQYPEVDAGSLISISDDPVLADIVISRESYVLFADAGQVKFIPPVYGVDAATPVLVFPVITGRRVVGLVVFLARQPDNFTSQVIGRCKAALDKVAHVVETGITFAGVARYLAQLALLHEVAFASTTDVEVGEAARRVVERLKRVFRTELVTISFFDEGRQIKESYGSQTKGQANGDWHEGFIRSAIAIPMKFRGRVVGMIEIANQDENRYVTQDEQLLSVVASQLAGMFENFRLHQETRDWAHSLSLLHKVIELGAGLTSPNEIAGLVAEQCGEYFGYELVAIFLMDRDREQLVVRGVGGRLGHRIRTGFSASAFEGTIGSVFQSGKSYFSSNVAQDTFNFSLPDWQAGSEACISLSNGGPSDGSPLGEPPFGVIVVQMEQKGLMTEKELQRVESLAEILTSILLSAFRYQETKPAMEDIEFDQNRLVEKAHGEG